MSFETGPYLQTAVLCEKALQEKDGVLSLIRVIDRITIAARGTEVPDHLPPGTLGVSAVITLKSGEAKGRGAVTLRHQFPSGLVEPVATFPVLLEGEERGVNIVIGMQMRVEHEGLHWFHVLYEDQLLTKMPLRIFYAPQQVGSPPAQP